jgi:hypothetical protein
MKKFLILAGVMFLVFSLAACSLLTPAPAGEVQQRKQRWTAQNILDYRYVLENRCFCVAEVRQPVQIEVRSGQMRSIKTYDGDRSVNEEYFEAYDTIPKLFDLIQKSVDQKAAKISVDYDLKLGFPTRIFIDRSEMIADEEISLDIYGFEIIR